jgi:branched-chain amino acid transport system substrate-binding protein
MDASGLCETGKSRLERTGEDMMARFVSALAICCCLLALTPFRSVVAEEAAPWIVAEVTPLTGIYSTVGARLSRSAKMWADEVNRGGGIKGRKIRLITCNDESRPEKSVACARDVLREGAVVVLGHGTIVTARAIMPVLANGPVLIVASPNVVPAPNTLVFQTSPSDEDLLSATGRFLLANNVNRLSMIAATDAAGEAQVAAATKIFKAQNIDLALRRIDLKATDASAQIAAVSGPDAKALFSSYSGGGAATVVKSFTNLGLKQPLIISYANLSEAFMKVVKDYLPPRLLGISVRALIPDAIDDPVLRARAIKFMEDYRKTYDEEADMINILGKFDVDVAEAILTSVDDPKDTAAVKTFLEKSTVESLHRMHFSPTSHVGLTTDDVIIAEYKSQRWVKADPIR